MTYTTPDDLRNLRTKYREGTFDPTQFNWAVGENAVPVASPDSPDGWRYAKRVCVYIMCDGSQQCFGEFPLRGEPTPERWEMARRIIRETFDVERILNGVG